MAGPNGSAGGYFLSECILCPMTAWVLRVGGMGGMDGSGRHGRHGWHESYARCTTLEACQSGVPDLGYVLNNVPGNVAGFGMNQAGPSQTFGGSPQSSKL